MNASLSSGVLVTRPEPGASATAKRLRDMGFTPILSPLLEVRMIPDALGGDPGPLQAVLVTSANAIPALAALRPVPLFAVGDATARAARQAGHSQVESAGKDAAALADLVRARLSPVGAPLLLASGKGQGRGLYQALIQTGFTVLHRFVYCAAPVSILPAPAERALRSARASAPLPDDLSRLGSVLFFSPETGRSFVRLLIRAGLAEAAAGLVACAISQPAAEAVSPLPWRDIRVAVQPTQDNILALLR